MFYTHTFTQRNKFESNKVGTYRNTSLIHKGQRQHLISEKNKKLCNNCQEGGWEIRGGEREGELDVKFNTYGGGALLFHSICKLET